MRTLLIIFSLVLLLAVTLSAQTPSKPFNLYAGAGLSFTGGDFGDSYKTGYNAFGRIGLKTFPRVEFLLGLDIHSNSIDDANFITNPANLFNYPGLTSVDGGKATTLLFASDLKVNLGLPTASFNPFVLAGVGVARVKISGMTFITNTLSSDKASNSSTKVFYELGGGVEFGRIFVQGKFVKINDVLSVATGLSSSPNMISIDLGIKI